MDLDVSQVKYEVRLTHHRQAKKPGGWRWGWSYQIDPMIGGVDWQALNVKPPKCGSYGSGLKLTPPVPCFQHESTANSATITRAVFVAGCSNDFGHACSHDDAADVLTTRSGVVWCNSRSELETAVEWSTDIVTKTTDLIVAAIQSWIDGWLKENSVAIPASEPVVVSRTGQPVVIRPSRPRRTPERHFRLKT